MILVATGFSFKLIDESTVRWVIIGAALIALGILSVKPFIDWKFTHYVLTSDRLITRTGFIAKHSKEIPLERINDVTFSQRVLERMVGAGDLMVESAGERGQTRLRNVRKPEQVQLMIYKETEENNNRMMRGGAAAQPAQPAQQAAAPSESVTDQIEALKRLKDAGAITDMEFENKKSELLKRL